MLNLKGLVEGFEGVFMPFFFFFFISFGYLGMIGSKIGAKDNSALC